MTHATDAITEHYPDLAERLRQLHAALKDQVPESAPRAISGILFVSKDEGDRAIAFLAASGQDILERLGVRNEKNAEAIIQAATPALVEAMVLGMWVNAMGFGAIPIPTKED